MGKIIILKIQDRCTTSAEIREKIQNDIVFVGLRSAIGDLHGISKFSPGFAENLPNM